MPHQLMLVNVVHSGIYDVEITGSTGLLVGAWFKYEL